MDARCGDCGLRFKVIEEASARLWCPRCNAPVHASLAASLLRVFEQIDEMKAAHRAILDEKPIRGA